MNSGGWIEQYEIEIDAMTLESELPPEDSEIRRISDLKADMGRAIGRDFQISYKMKELIEAAGFVDVQEQKVKLPLGPWASDAKLKDIGRFFERFYKTGLQGWLMHICTRFLGVSEYLLFPREVLTFAAVDAGSSQRFVRQSIPRDQRKTAAFLFPTVSRTALQTAETFSRNTNQVYSVIVVGRKP